MVRPLAPAGKAGWATGGEAAQLRGRYTTSVGWIGNVTRGARRDWLIRCGRAVTTPCAKPLRRGRGWAGAAPPARAAPVRSIGYIWPAVKCDAGCRSGIAVGQ